MCPSPGGICVEEWHNPGVCHHHPWLHQMPIPNMMCPSCDVPSFSLQDNKINLAGGMIMRLREKYSLSLEAQVFYHYGYTSSEVNAVLLAWREKVKHDRIRPTSLVQMRGDEMLTSWMGATEHRAADWVPYKRVMPHSEYPSGSGCICTAVKDYVDAFMQDTYGEASIETTWEFAAGSSNVQPGAVPAESITKIFANMTELRDMCGVSRLWGGMHFSASVPDSYRLCEGVGNAGYAMMQALLGEGSFSELMDDSKLRFGDKTAPNSKFIDAPTTQPPTNKPDAFFCGKNSQCQAKFTGHFCTSTEVGCKTCGGHWCTEAPHRPVPTGFCGLRQCTKIAGAWCNADEGRCIAQCKGTWCPI